jgi:hypothetical protein
MTGNLHRRAAAIGLAGAMTLAGMTSSFAAPVLSNAAGLKAAVPNDVAEVRWRGWHRGGGGAAIAGGLAAGALLGAGIAAATAPRYYYGGYGPAYGYSGYGSYAYDYPYSNAPLVYGAPAYGSSYAYPYQTCGFDGGYGRWDYSQC